MSYVYRNTGQPKHPLFTVGHSVDGAWCPESDHRTAEEAAARVHWLNGGLAREEIEQFADILCRALAERAINTGGAHEDPDRRTDSPRA